MLTKNINFKNLSKLKKNNKKIKKDFKNFIKSENNEVINSFVSSL